jgi:hypothetical protein
MAAACLERTLDAADEIQRNVHPATLVECWFHDLTRIMQPARSTSGEQRKTR